MLWSRDVSLYLLPQTVRERVSIELCVFFSFIKKVCSFLGFYKEFGFYKEEFGDDWSLSLPGTFIWRSGCWYWYVLRSKSCKANLSPTQVCFSLRG